MSVRLGEPGDASEEDIQEEPERPAAGREARWARIAQSAVKQCLRRDLLMTSHVLGMSLFKKHILRSAARESRCLP